MLTIIEDKNKEYQVIYSKEFHELPNQFKIDILVSVMYDLENQYNQLVNEE